MKEIIKKKLKKFKKNNNFTLDEAIESFIIDRYQEEYEEYDMDDYEETIFTIIDLYFKFADILYKEHGDIFKDITKENLDKVICHGEYTTRDYLYEELFDKLVEYDDNYEGLKALMVA